MSIETETTEGRWRTGERIGAAKRGSRSIGTAAGGKGCDSAWFTDRSDQRAQSNTRLSTGLNKRVLTCGQTLSACGWPACVLSSAKSARQDRQSVLPVVY